MEASGSYDGRYRYSFQRPKVFGAVRNQFRTTSVTRWMTAGSETEGFAVAATGDEDDEAAGWGASGYMS
jgi:hypothetical protein